MLDATIKICTIDYESSLQHIFPAVSEKIMSWDSKNMLVRLFQQIGDDALPILISVIHRLPEETKKRNFSSWH